MRVVQLAVVAGLTACSSIGFRSQGTQFGVGAEPTSRPGVSPAAARSGTARPAETKRVCRSSGRAAGWIAIDYVDGEGCGVAQTAGNAHAVAVLVDYRNLNVGSELEVCGDEHIPAGWTIDHWLDESNGRCPDDAPKGDTARRTVKRIRRLN